MEEFILMKNHSAAQNVNKFSPSQHLKTHERIHNEKKYSAVLVWEQILRQECLEETWNNSYWWKTIKLFKVGKEIFRQECLEDTWKNLYWKKTIQLLNTAHHSIWRHMREFILMKNHSAVQSVRTNSQTGVLGRDMK